MPELLLELFSEEIPARMQGQGAKDLARLFTEQLKAAGLTPQNLRTSAGPRRLTLVCDLPAATESVSEELKGPKTSAPPQALEGFLRKTGLTREQLTERDGVLFAVTRREGRATAALIPQMVEAVVRGFPWPKSMRSGTSAFRWVRPLKRILCVFDGAVVPFAIEGVESGDVTEGHRFLGLRKPFSVDGFEAYARKLSEHFVVLDAEDRKARILGRAHRVCADAGMELVEDAGLLEEVSGLAEWPTPIFGDMDPAFLDLPSEVIRTSMRTHQKYFAVRRPSQSAAPTALPEGEHLHPRSPPSGGSTPEGGEEGSPSQLAPHFLVVANIEPSDGGAAVAHGNARVLSARLNDARFFWDEDRRPGAFEGWLEKLQGVTFHAKLGTLAERAERIAALAREIAPLVGANPDLAETAGRLCKADLASQMVGEFPELQGVMGGYYARGQDQQTLAKLGSPFSLEGRRAGDEGEGADPAADGAGGGAASNAIRPDTGANTLTPGPSPFEGEGSASARDQIADAIRDHYKPQGPADAVPSAPVTVAVALADKLDTLVGFFAIGEKPTGSKDPYALRRAALGVIRLVLESGQELSLRELASVGYARLLYISEESYRALHYLMGHPDELEAADASRSRDDIAREIADLVRYPAWLFRADTRELTGASVGTQEVQWPQWLDDIYGINLVQWDPPRPFSIDSVGLDHAIQFRTSLRNLQEDVRGRLISRTNELLAFFADRLKVLLRDQGRRHDLVDAVFALGDDDLVRIVRRVEALDTFLATDDGANLLAGYKRAANILRAEQKKNPGETYDGDIELDLQTAPEEQALSMALTALSFDLTARLAAEDFEGAMRALARLRAPVDAFFEGVLVNDPDPAVRLNRLRLLTRVTAAMNQVADFGQVSG